MTVSRSEKVLMKRYGITLKDISEAEKRLDRDLASVPSTPLTELESGSEGEGEGDGLPYPLHSTI